MYQQTLARTCENFTSKFNCTSLVTKSKKEREERRKIIEGMWGEKGGEERGGKGKGEKKKEGEEKQRVGKMRGNSSHKA